METKTVETRHAPVRYLEGGSGEPLVFLHGAGGMTADDPFLNELAEPLPRLRAASCPAMARPRSAGRCATCSTSRCTAGTWSRRWG